MAGGQFGNGKSLVCNYILKSQDCSQQFLLELKMKYPNAQWLQNYFYNNNLNSPN
jgi:hypothetical protein